MHDDPVIYANRWKILAVLCTSLMIVIIGNTALNVAIPRLALDLDASTTDLQWMVDAYSLVFAGMLFTAGTIGDRFGRKGTLQARPGPLPRRHRVRRRRRLAPPVIGARAVMGLAAAFVMPSTLSILTNVFPPDERPKAIAVWAGIAGGGAAIGPIASGLPARALLVGLGLPRQRAGDHPGPRRRPHPAPDLPRPRAAAARHPRRPAVDRRPRHARLRHHRGPAARLDQPRDASATFAVAGARLAALRLPGAAHAEHPMLDLRFFRDRRFSVASGGMTLIFFAMFGTFFLVSQYFQLVLGYTALESGLFQLPMAFVMMGLSPQVPKLVNRFGVARVVPAGLSSVAVGLVLFSLLGVDTSIWLVYGPILFLAAGMALTMTPLTTLIMSAVPVSKAGVGSAMNDTTRELGGALGVAVLGSLVTSTYASSHRRRRRAASPGPTRRRPSPASSVPSTSPSTSAPRAPRSIEAAKQAFVDGMGVAAIAGAVVVALAAIVSYRLLPHGPGPDAGARSSTPSRRPADEEFALAD